MDQHTHPEFDVLRQQADQYLAGWQRAKADYLNLKKQAERDRQELVKFANAALLTELLPVYDNLKRAVAHVPADAAEQDWVKGFQHIYQQFRQLLEQIGIREIATVGQPFDPERHHAVSQEVRSDRKPGTVISEAKTGFILHEKVIEPAMVTVATGSEDSAAKQADESPAPKAGSEKEKG